jgi:FkbM family methyltransferase
MGSPSKPVCGMPRNNANYQNAKSSNASTTTRSGKVYCIEPMPSTVNNLRRALDTSPDTFSEYLIIKHAAMSNTSGIALFPDGSNGQEGSSLADCQALLLDQSPPVVTTDPSPTCVTVPMYSLDDFFNNDIDVDDLPKQDIDILLIDAEGFDYEILQGSPKTLQRVKYLTFEVHITGNWMKHSLVETIKTTLKDFTCYWAGKKQLWRMTNCFGSNSSSTEEDDDELKNIYELKSWSNVACVRQTEVGLARIMEDTFLNSI